MSLMLKKYILLIEVVSGIKNDKVRSAVLKTIKRDSRLFKVLREIAKNTVNGVVPLSKQQKRKLRKYKNTIRKLTSSHKECRNRCELIVQSGGFLPILIPSVLSILGSLLLK